MHYESMYHEILNCTIEQKVRTSHQEDFDQIVRVNVDVSKHVCFGETEIPGYEETEEEVRRAHGEGCSRLRRRGRAGCVRR